MQIESVSFVVKILIHGEQVLCLIFEMTGALAVGARTASTIKNGIIPLSAFQGNAPVQLLAFTCAAAGASIWVMWCTRHNAHVSSTYSLVSSIAGVGVATVGVKGVQWGWNSMWIRHLYDMDSANNILQTVLVSVPSSLVSSWLPSSPLSSVPPFSCSSRPPST
jgi:phosphate/sulfate permease